MRSGVAQTEYGRYMQGLINTVASQSPKVANERGRTSGLYYQNLTDPVFRVGWGMMGPFVLETRGKLPERIESLESECPPTQRGFRSGNRVSSYSTVGTKKTGGLEERMGRNGRKPGS